MTSKKDKKEIEIDSCCMNCNYFFTYPLYELSEYGICLKDPVFEPYIDELIERENTDTCKDLIDAKKFEGNDNCCKDFEMVEGIEVETSSKSLGVLINNDFKQKSIEGYDEKLKSSNPETQLKAFQSLSVLVSCGNVSALNLLVRAFIDIPAPQSLSETHQKLKIFRVVKNEDNNDIILALIRDLYETKSNNQTRQWIAEIYKYFSYNNDNKIVIEALTKILSEEQFSYKIKNKVREILELDY